MWPVSIANAISAAGKLRTAMASQAFAKTCLKTSAVISGRVSTAEEKARNAALLLSQRECLIAELREAQRQHKPTKQIRKALCSVTNEALNA